MNRRCPIGYAHILNLYKNQDILLHKECYALEKVHGTSAHVTWDGSKLIFFSGGEKYDNFIKFFDLEKLDFNFRDLGINKITVYGEAYGGKCQGMKDTYGPDLRFIAFDVNIDDKFINIPDAEEIATKLGLEFVPYKKITADISSIDAERDAFSIVAIRRGMGENKRREGVVLRPIIEVTKNNGERVCAKHKGEGFSERKTPPKVNTDKIEILKEAQLIADEWVTEMRLKHVLQKIEPIAIESTKKVISAMIEDVYREGEGEIVESKEVNSCIGKATAILFKRYLQSHIGE